MNKKYQNVFFFFGIGVLALMLTQLNFAEVWNGLRHAGYWFAAIVGIWALLYLLNTAAWLLIINSSNPQKTDSSQHNSSSFSNKTHPQPISFWWLYKITISGFALNYATPVGLMGGEPYRIMELSPRIGTERASSSVILYAMTHIFSHFCFWALCIVLFLFTQPLTPFLGIILGASSILCVVGLWFFIDSYRKGLAYRLMNVLRHLPYIKRWAKPFIEKNKEKLDTIDAQIAALHKQNKQTFFAALCLELACRCLSALEIMFALWVLTPNVDYLLCVFVLGFTSLFANLLFFMPLQLGGREGGFLMSISQLGLSVSSGIFVALLIRLRELIWTAIGLLLIKVKSKAKSMQ